MITLQPYKGPSTRYHCPQCRDRQKTFSRYIDTDTNQQLADHVGRCSREVKCGYHYGPKQYFAETSSSRAGVGVITNPHRAGSSRRPMYPAHRELVGENTNQGAKTQGLGFGISNLEFPPSFIPERSFMPSLMQHSSIHEVAAQNNFVHYLLTQFGAQAAADAVQRYLIGTSSHRFTNSAHPGYTSPAGATIFWQGDEDYRVRTGKIMLYDAHTGKRVKQPFNHITWAHIGVRGAESGERGETGIHPPLSAPIRSPHASFSAPIRSPLFHLQQCLFGAHLLGLYGGKKPVAITESEKSAIIASIYLPQFVWLAAGSLNNLSEAKCRALQGRQVTLYPDLGCYDAWCRKASELRHIATVRVSAVLEQKASATHRAQGYDLADYLVQHSVAAFNTAWPKP